MNQFITVLIIGVVGITGCSRTPTTYEPHPYLPPPENPLAGLTSEPIAPLAKTQATIEVPQLEPTPVPANATAPLASSVIEQMAPPPQLSRFPLEGVFACSGWMGDAERSGGPLTYEISVDNPYRGPTCDKWTYAPPGDSLELRWIAVAYQGPKENNWGQHRGVDLSGRNFTKLTFMARGAAGGERILVRSGGCTQYDAPYPASHESTLGIIELLPSWRRFEIPLEGCSLVNVCSAFSFTINRAMAPGGCAFYLDEIGFEGGGL